MQDILHFIKEAIAIFKGLRFAMLVLVAILLRLVCIIKLKYEVYFLTYLFKCFLLFLLKELEIIFHILRAAALVLVCKLFKAVC